METNLKYSLSDVRKVAELKNFRTFFQIHHSQTSDSGLKISIQGKTIDDVMYIYDKLGKYLYDNDIGFKIATQKCFNRYDKDNPVLREQCRKAFTIYHNDTIDFKQLCEDIYNLIPEYKGWYDIPTPTDYEHYAGGLFIRNSYDENGNYLKAIR